MLNHAERDYRVLIRGIQKWGDIRSRYDTIIKEARLEGKNRVIIIQTCEEIIAQAEEAVAERKAHIRELQDKGEPITSSLRQKAVLFQYKSVGGLNAETVAARHYELKALVEHFKRIGDPDEYAIPHEHLKPTMNWTVDWTAKDDAHLVVGIWRHGFGSWEQITQVSFEDEAAGGADWLFRILPSNSQTKYTSKTRKLPKRTRRLLSLVSRVPYTLCGGETTSVNAFVQNSSGRADATSILRWLGSRIRREPA